MEPQMPRTYQEAIQLWDAGEPLAVFQVEAEEATQLQMWGWAFACLRPEADIFPGDLTGSNREIDVIKSIVHVARLEPWDKMIERHIDPRHSPAITIQKAKV